jgi:putative chitinase
MSEALKKVQEKIGSTPDGAFGPNTAKQICNHYALNPERGAHFLGQLVHESGTFKYTEENLNYSTEAILKVFGKYFESESEAETCKRNPQALADRVYGGRMGNDGQGYLWRGRGFLQCTGKNNYSQFAADMDLPEVMKDPDLMASDYPMESAIWFFHRNKLWDICDKGVNDDVIKSITRRVNGGYNGLKHRQKETHKIYDWLS